MKKEVLITTYAVQSRGPVLSGMMLDNGPALNAAILLQAGYHPTIRDYNSVRTIKEIARDGKEAFVNNVVEQEDADLKRSGAKIHFFKIYINGFRDMLYIARELKKRNPDVLIAGVGPQVGWFGEDLLTHPKSKDAFDVLLYGDGDLAGVSLADYVYRGRPLHEVPNIIYLDNGRVKKTGKLRRDMGQKMPFPVYHPEIYLGVEDKIFLPVVEDSRGCNNSCSFCVHSRISGAARPRRIEHILEEVEHNRKEYHLRVFRLSGSNPLPQTLNSLAAQLPDGTSFSTFFYANDALDIAGLSDKLICGFMGLESTDPHILKDVLNKTNDSAEYLRRAREAIITCEAAGIPLVAAMIVPSPFETNQTLQRSVEFLKDADPTWTVALPMGPLPETAINKRSQRIGAESGVVLDDDFIGNNMFFELDNLRPYDEWPDPPFQLVINGEPTHDVLKYTGLFLSQLGASSFSDEIALMADLYLGGLSKDKAVRRKQGMEFNAMARKCIVEGDYKGLQSIVERINSNQMLN